MASIESNESPTVGGSPVPAQPRRALQQPLAASPEVDGTFVTFRLHAPAAQQVEVALNYPYGVRQPMTRDAQGTWSLRLGPCEPRLYSYFFYLDDVAVPDPSNPQSGRRINTAYSLVDVPGPQPRIDQPRTIPHGEIHRHFHPSKLWQERFPGQGERRLFVYTPPEWDGRPLPVAYLRHGAEQNEESWFAAGAADVMLDNLIHDGRCKPLIVVTSSGYAMPTPGGQIPADRAAPGALAFLREELVNEIVPFIDRRYRTIANRAGRAIAGLSMGAGQAFLIGLKRPDLFGYVGEFSSGVLSADGFSVIERFPELAERPAPAQQLWLGCGSDDRRRTGHQRLSNALTELDVAHSLQFVPGSHEWRTWRALFAKWVTEIRWPAAP